MFTYNLTDSTIENGQCRVTFEFTNGTVKVSRTWFVTSEDDINRRIKDEINSLDNTVALKSRLVNGAYTVVEKPEEPIKELTPLELATQNLYQLKEKISLGVLKETDQEFVDAVTAYKVALNVK